MINLSAFTTQDIIFGWISLFCITLFLFTLAALIRAHNSLIKIKNNEKKRWEELELRAQKDYQDTINSANKRAQEILLQAIQIKRESTTNFQASVDIILENQKQVLEATSKEVSEAYKKTIDQVNRDNVNLLTNIYKGVENDAETNFAKYRQILADQTFSAEKIAEEKIKTEFQKMEKEIEESKKLKLEALNEKIYKIIQDVSKDIIGRSLTLSDHENLVIESLEKAKKEGKL